MLPRKFRNRMFERMSNKTMRPQFHAIAKRDAVGLVAEVLEQSEQDFFINGTITCHAVCPELMAGMWSGGREAALVSDRVPAWLKKAMGAALSRVNQCPYCEDMLVGLTFGAKQRNVAASLHQGEVDQVEDEYVRAVMEWAQASVDADDPRLARSPFGADELPEAIGTLFTFCYTNKITDLTMYGSPVRQSIKGITVRVLGRELAESAALELEPGRSLGLLPVAEPAADLAWAAANPRVADALARWVAVVDAGVDAVLSPNLRQWLQGRIDAWRGGVAPMSRAWVEEEIAGLDATDQAIARLALLVVKASYQIDDAVIDEVLAQGVDDAGVLRLGAWAALSAARRVATWTVQAVGTGAFAVAEPARQRRGA